MRCLTTPGHCLFCVRVVYGSCHWKLLSRLSVYIHITCISSSCCFSVNPYVFAIHTLASFFIFLKKLCVQCLLERRPSYNFSYPHFLKFLLWTFQESVLPKLSSGLTLSLVGLGSFIDVCVTFILGYCTALPSILSYECLPKTRKKNFERSFHFLQ